MILALDMATRTGWASGVIGAVPSWGAQDFGRNRSNGEVLSAFRSWLCGKMDEIQPSICAFESPYMPGPNSPFSAPANASTIRRLFAFAGITEAVCFERRLKCYEARPSEITRAFLGGPAPKRREEKKAATVKMARLLGFDVADDDEADAVALWCFAEAQFSPAMISRRRAGRGLELDLHGSKTKSAPRSDPRSARSIPDGRSENGSDVKKYNSAAPQLQFGTG
jgi:Holliday junction resolvasome RuvABC endonuclease subunit